MIETNDPEKQDIEHAVTEKPRSGSVSGGLALILVLITMVATAYIGYLLLYQHRDLLKNDVIGRLNLLDKQQQATKNSIDQLSSENTDTKERQKILVTGLERVNTDLGRDRADWIIAETEQLLRIANHRLHLARDIDTAITALKTADRQLRRLSNPRYLEVRRTISQEISALQSLERVDIPGIALRLGTMAANVDRLPILHKPSFEQEKTSNAYKKAEKQKLGFWKRIWRDLNGHFQIRDTGVPYNVLLPPKQEYFLRENVRLMLYAAQQALLQGKTEVYQQNLKASHKWLKLYFDTDSKVVKAAVDELDSLLGKRIVEKLPNISNSLSMLRKVHNQSKQK